MVPSIESFNIDIPTPQSALIHFPQQLQTSKPKITGFKVSWYSDSQDDEKTSEIIKSSEKSWLCENLEMGAPYCFSIRLVGEHEEGLPSKSQYVSLAGI